MGITLKAARVNKNLTQKEAAKKLGVSVATLQDYEAAKSFPSVPTIQKMEVLYDVPYSDIIFMPNEGGDEG